MAIHVHGYRLQNEKYNTPFPYVWDVEQNNDRLTRPRYKSCFLLEALSEVDCTWRWATVFYHVGKKLAVCLQMTKLIT